MRAFGIFTAPKRSLRQGNVFTGVCLSIDDWYPSMHHRSHDQHPGEVYGFCIQEFCILGVCIWRSLPTGMQTPGDWADPLDADPPGTRKAGSIHPTGMLSFCDEYA